MIKYHVSKPCCKFEQRTLQTNEQNCKESRHWRLNNKYSLCDVPAIVFLADFVGSLQGFLLELTRGFRYDS